MVDVSNNGYIADILFHVIFSNAVFGMSCEQNLEQAFGSLGTESSGRMSEAQA